MLAVVNPGQVFLFEDCLNLLWNFGETIHDQKFILSKGVLCLYIDAVLLQPDSCKVCIDCTPRSRWDTVFSDSDVTPGVNEAGIRCLSGLIEYDAETQEKVSKMSPLIDKLLSMTDGYSTINSYINSYQITYSLSSRQVASKSLFHCTYNVKSAQPLVDCGALAKMIKITKKVLIDNDSDVPLRYFCCLFLARLRSAPLVTLDRDTCVAIDKLIDMFLNRHVPNEILKWEEKKCAIWMTIVPLVHLAFAAGKQYYSHSDMNDNKQHGYQISAKQLSEEACFIESYLSKTTVPKVHEAKSGGMKKSQGTWSSPYLLDSDSREENVSSESRKITTSFMSENDKCVKVCRKDQLTWPGSTSAQKLGIFSLVHTLAIKENLQTALSENLLPYLVCLSWHLRCDEREQLRASLANFHNDPAPPSLKVAAKSVLAIVYGLDMVFNL